MQDREASESAVVVVDLKLLVLQPKHLTKLHQWWDPLADQQHEEDPVSIPKQ